MPWLLLLHICALLIWFGTLLYLPGLIYAFATNRINLRHEVEEEHRSTSMPRMVFTVVSTPAALLAIAAGTGVFLADGRVALWLMVKLNVVLVLVLCHALVGYLIYRAEAGQHRRLGAYCTAAAAACSATIIAILWLVLAKPWQEV